MLQPKRTKFRKHFRGKMRGIATTGSSVSFGEIGLKAPLKKSAIPTAPKTLSTEARSWWRRLATEYGIQDEAGQLLLQTALEAFDRLRSAQRTIKQDGPTVTDRWGQIKPHPLLAAERDARSGMLQSLRALNLDLEPLKDIGRPGGK